MSGKRSKIIAAAITLMVLGFGIFTYIKKGQLLIWQNNQQTATSTATHISTTTSQALKTYRNEEWGFEFQYPADLILKEKVFGGYYSKFNLVLFKRVNDAQAWAIVLNIVLPKFVDTDFWKTQTNHSLIEVGGLSGVKHEYEFEGFPQIDVILPIKDMKIIIGTGEDGELYTDELNQILSSFRFLKQQ